MSLQPKAHYYPPHRLDYEILCLWRETPHGGPAIVVHGDGDYTFRTYHRSALLHLTFLVSS